MEWPAEYDWVETQLIQRGIANPRVIAAMREVPRQQFVPAKLRASAYEDRPLPIGYGQTISQPYIVAYMTSLLSPRKDQKILEIGTGSGYQAAILSKLAAQVFSIEIVKPLALQAARALRKLAIANVTIKIGDGHLGWPEEAPFDDILLAAAPPEIPQALLDQLRVGGTIVAPIGTNDQHIVRWKKETKEHFEQEDLIPVRFVHMTT